MDVEKQVCSLELSKKLKELNINQESIFYYEVFTENSYKIHFASHSFKVFEGDNIYSAFTVAELGNIIPNYVLTKDAEPFNGFRIFIEKFLSVEDNHTKNNWVINYYCDSVEIQGEQAFVSKKLTSNIYDPNLADAMAKMLIYLIEKGIWLFAPQSRVGD